MAPKPVLVTGATGLLGRSVMCHLQDRPLDWKVTGVGLTRCHLGKGLVRLDITSEDAVCGAFDEFKPEVVIHCAAQKYPDKVEADYEAAWVLNVDATRALAKHCAARSVLFIYVSTDYVFSGQPGEAPYETDAPTGPSNKYGILKRAGEIAVLEEFSASACPAYGVCLRVPILYGKADVPEEGSINLLVDNVWKAQTENKPISHDHWARRYPTNTEDVARVLCDIGVKYIEAGPRSSLPHILHFTGETCLTKYEMCCVFAEILCMSRSLLHPAEKPTTVEGVASRPYDCHLSTRALQDIGISVANCDFTGWWRRELRAFRR